MKSPVRTVEAARVLSETTGCLGELGMMGAVLKASASRARSWPDVGLSENPADDCSRDTGLLGDCLGVRAVPPGVNDGCAGGRLDVLKTADGFPADEKTVTTCALGRKINQRGSFGVPSSRK